MQKRRKGKRTWLLLFSFLFVIQVLLTGCAKGVQGINPSTTGDVTNISSTATGDDTNEPAVKEETIPVSILSQIKVVYNQDASDVIIQAAQKIADAIKAIYKVEILATSDYVRADSEYFCEKEYEILVGQTNREQDDSYGNIRLNDSLYAMVGTKIVIQGGNENAIAEAVSHFTFDIITKKKGGSDVFYSNLWDRVFLAKYTVSNLTLNGKPITDYCILYSESETNFEKGIATHLANRIEALTGYSIAVQKDTEAYQGENEILVGNTSRTDANSIVSSATEALNGVVGATGNLIVLAGKDIYGINCAAENLLEQIQAATDEQNNSAVTIEQTVTAIPAQDVSIMTFNVFVGDRNDARIDRVIKMISTYLPDLVGLQEADPKWIKLLKEKFGMYYTFIGEPRTSGTGEATAIMVAKHRFDIVEEGTRWLTDTPNEVSILPGAEYHRVFSYVRLEDQVNNTTFLHINTHLDTASDSIRTKEVEYIFDFLGDDEYKDIPVLLTGDMNAPKNSGSILTITNNGFTSVSDLYEGENSTINIDWIFATADCINAEFLRICNERVDGDYPSDHFPIYGKVSFFIPEGGIQHQFGEVLPVVPNEYLQPIHDEKDTFGHIHRIS